MRTFVLTRSVEFGDCDPAGIVFYPNFYRWFDHATHQMFGAAGYPFDKFRSEFGLIGWPLIETGARYRLPLAAGDEVEIHSTVSAIHDKTFRVEHRILRGGEVAVEGFEIRIVAEKIADAPVKLRATPLPQVLRRWFE